MAIHGYFFNAVKNDDVYDRVYNAEDVTSYLDKLVGSGVFPNPSTQLQVTAGVGMQVVVAEGQGWINGHKIINDADLPLEIDAADVLLGRIDSVIFYVDFTTREMGIEVKKGTLAPSPQIPALVRNASRYEMMLATVTVAKQTDSITPAMITDTRANSAVCGYVAGLIQQVDTETLFLQYQAAYEEMERRMASWMDSQQAAFESWLATLTEQLQVGAYVKKFEKSVTNPTGEIVLNMTDYVYEPSDVVLVFLNGLSGTEGTDYTLDTTGEQAKIVLSISAGLLSNTVKIVVLKAILGTPITAGSVWEQVQTRNVLQMNVNFTQEEE